MNIFTSLINYKTCKLKLFISDTDFLCYEITSIMFLNNYFLMIIETISVISNGYVLCNWY